MDEKRKITRKYLGRGGGGFWDKTKDILMKPFTSTMYYDRSKDGPVESKPIEKTYDVRGMKVGDSDLAEAKDILYSEVSNRPAHKQAFEVKHIVNTALNRMATRKGKTLAEVFQEPYQYQGYAPKGVTKGNKVVKSQYQLVKENDPSISQEKMKIIQQALDELKSGKFQDTTGGAQFYVHASDGTMWLGKTIKEAKQNALRHEREANAQRSRFGTSTGLPNY